MTLQHALRAITGGETLSPLEAEAVMGELMDGHASPVLVAALLSALKTRGETAQEISGFVRAMRARMVRVEVSGRVVDSCGTGGDAPKHGVATFNVSTAAAIIAASAGARVAKHGNRAASSQSGSADVLEALGVNMNVEPPAVAACIEQLGIGFMFAPSHHPGMKHVAPIRHELGIRTIFNLVGPLCNPASAQSQVVGVPEAKWLRPIAETLRDLGTTRALVVHSDDGMDEISTCAGTSFIEVRNGALHIGRIEPGDYGSVCMVPRALEGGHAARNAEIISQLLHDGQGPTADLACLNAGAILWISDVTPNLQEGVKLARAAANAGAARELLARLVEYTNKN